MIWLLLHILLSASLRRYNESTNNDSAMGFNSEQESAMDDDLARPGKFSKQQPKDRKSSTNINPTELLRSYLDEDEEINEDEYRRKGNFHSPDDDMPRNEYRRNETKKIYGNEGRNRTLDDRTPRSSDGYRASNSRLAGRAKSLPPNPNDRFNRSNIQQGLHKKSDGQVSNLSSRLKQDIRELKKFIIGEARRGDRLYGRDNKLQSPRAIEDKVEFVENLEKSLKILEQ